MGNTAFMKQKTTELKNRLIFKPGDSSVEFFMGKIYV